MSHGPKVAMQTMQEWAQSANTEVGHETTNANEATKLLNWTLFL